MGPPSFKRSVVDRYGGMRRIPVLLSSLAVCSYSLPCMPLDSFVLYTFIR